MAQRLTVILPVYNEEKILKTSVKRIVEELEKLDIVYEVILSDDGSRDHSWALVKELCSENSSIRGVRLSRNFGKESAIFAGMEQAKGDAVVVMDVDLQHPPELIGEMVEKWRQGAQLVEARKKVRQQENVINRFCARSFYRILFLCSGIEMQNSSDFRLMDRQVVDALMQMPEKHTFFRAMSRWVGFRQEIIEFEVPPRIGGGSKWSGWKLARLAINAITSFSTMPLQIVTICGAIYFLFALIMLVQTLYMKFSGQALSGFTTIIVLLLFTGSIIMLSLGILGIYIGKVYEEVKGRPRYVIKEKIG